MQRFPSTESRGRPSGARDPPAWRDPSASVSGSRDTGVTGFTTPGGLHAPTGRVTPAGQSPTDDEGAVVGCQSGLRPRDTPLRHTQVYHPLCLAIPVNLP